MRKTVLFVSILFLLAACSGNVSPSPEAPSPSAEEASVAPSPVPSPQPSPTPEPEIPRLDFTALPDPTELEADPSLPDLFTSLAGDPVETEWQYKARLQELRDLYQYYMYGFYPDTAGEKVSYTLDGQLLTVTIEKNGQTVSFDAFVALPDPVKTPMPEGGYPVILEMSVGWDGTVYSLIPYQYALDRGYAVIAFNTVAIAADDMSRTGAFYDLYPYTDDILTQTGTLMAWGWGGGKVIDALEGGLAADTGVSTENIILTGVSRWGKAAAVAGAFDERIKVTMPACSGAGGMALYRYKSQGNVYDLTSIGGRTEMKMGSNEHLGSLKNDGANGEAQWFNDTFMKFTQYEQFPVDQHFLAALCGSNGRYLVITGSYFYEDWTNPPAMFGTYLAARKAFDFMGTPNHIAVAFHPEGHAVLEEDLEKLIAYCNDHLYGTPSPIDLATLQTTLYDSVEANRYPNLYELVGE